MFFQKIQKYEKSQLCFFIKFKNTNMTITLFEKFQKIEKYKHNDYTLKKFQNS